MSNPFNLTDEQFEKRAAKEGGGMSERPILYSSPMVRAILENRKTQTRRLVQLTDSGRVKETNGGKNWHADDPNAVLACPYGKVGDRLWVRESLRSLRLSENVYAAQYIADKELVRPAGNPQGIVCWQWKNPSLPSIHMPKSCCRIWLEITSVRLERLQEISENDAQAEGFYPSLSPLDSVRLGAKATFREGFRQGWFWINGTRAPWESNPWVWVIKFKRVDAKEAV